MEVIWMLQGDVLTRLRRKFQPCTSSSSGMRARVSLEAFVTEIYRALCVEVSSKDRPRVAIGMNPLQIHQLVERLCVLFDLVDVDSAGVIEWANFTDFCVFMRGRVKGDSQGQEGRSNASGGGERSQQDDITRYTEKLGCIERGSHSHEIKAMCFVKELGLLLVVEGTHLLEIYAAGPQKVAQIDPASEMRKMGFDKNKQSERIRVLRRKTCAGDAQRIDGSMAAARTCEENKAVQAAEFVGRKNQIVVSCADGYLTVWDLKTYKIIRYAHLGRVQMGLRFCPVMDILASWGADDVHHNVLVWNVETLKVIHVVSGHSGPIKDVCEVASSHANETQFGPMLATASMDGKVITWDLRLGIKGRQKPPKKVFILNGHHRGVVSVAYSDEHDLIISAGFDPNANCWNRYSSSIRITLVGHRLSLISVAIVRHETQRAVTGDEGGSFRLWDIQRGNSNHGTCLQTFSLGNKNAVPRTMVITWREDLVAAGRKMHVFRAKRYGTVQVPPGGVWFSSYTGEFCVLLKEVVVLDARVGRIRRRICHQTHGREITAFCFDSRYKKAVVGDQEGGVRVYDGITGRLVLSAASHRSEITALVFINEDETFVSAGWDRKIQVHDARVCSGKRIYTGNQRSPNASFENTAFGHRRAAVLRSVADAHGEDITLMAASFQLGLLVTASNDLTVRVWDYNLLRLEDVIIGHRYEISCVCFLDPLPCLATADMSGKILIWATKPHANASCLLAAIRNTVIVEEALSGWNPAGRPRVKRKVLPTPITALAFRHTASPTETIVQRSLSKPNGATTWKEDSDVKEFRLSAQQPRRSAIPASSSAKTCSTLFTGDKIGSIKVWDVTSILLEKLGSATCCTISTVDKATIPPKASDRNSTEAMRHRQGPLDGVGMQAATRFTELMEIAKALRGGYFAPPAKQASNDNSKIFAHTSRADHIDSTGSGSNPVSVGVKSSSRGKIANIFGEEKRASVMGRRRQDNDADGEMPVAKNANNYPSPTVTTEETDRKHTGQRANPIDHIEAVLNAVVNGIDPIASWTAHADSVTSIQVIVSPPSLLTGSLDCSVRIFALDGSLLGVVINKNEPGSSPWLFQTPVIGQETKARERAANFEAKLRSLHGIQRDAVHLGTADNSKILEDSKDQIEITSRVSFGMRKTAVASAEELSSTALFHSLRYLGHINSEGRPLSETPVMSTSAGERESGGLQRRSAISATCLSRIKEFTRAWDAVLPEDSETESTCHEGVDESLKAETREKQIYQAPGERQKPTSLARGVRDRIPNETGRKLIKVVEQHLPNPQKTAPNFFIEHHRKHAKRTRSALQVLSRSVRQTEGLSGTVGRLRPSTAPGSREKAARAPVEFSQGVTSFARPHTTPCAQAENTMDLQQDSTSAHLRVFSSSPTPRHASMTLASSMARQLGGGQHVLGRSKVPTLALTRRPSSAAAKVSIISGRPKLSNQGELVKRRAVDRRKQGIDNILDSVTRLGKGTRSLNQHSSRHEDMIRFPGAD